MSEVNIKDLEDNLIFFYTGIQRSSSEILKGQSQSAKKKDKEVIQSMHQIKEIGKECYNRFKDGDFDWFGNSLHNHWVMKKKISNRLDF